MNPLYDKEKYPRAYGIINKTILKDYLSDTENNIPLNTKNRNRKKEIERLFLFVEKWIEKNSVDSKYMKGVKDWKKVKEMPEDAVPYLTSTKIFHSKETNLYYTKSMNLRLMVYEYRSYEKLDLAMKYMHESADIRKGYIQKKNQALLLVDKGNVINAIPFGYYELEANVYINDRNSNTVIKKWNGEKFIFIMYNQLESALANKPKTL
jgi:hypothetical protein